MAALLRVAFPVMQPLTVPSPYEKCRGQDKYVRPDLQVVMSLLPNELIS